MNYYFQILLFILKLNRAYNLSYSFSFWKLGNWYMNYMWTPRKEINRGCSGWGVWALDSKTLMTIFSLRVRVSDRVVPPGEEQLKCLRPTSNMWLVIARACNGKIPASPFMLDDTLQRRLSAGQTSWWKRIWMTNPTREWRRKVT